MMLCIVFVTIILKWLLQSKKIMEEDLELSLVARLLRAFTRSVSTGNL